MQDLTPHREVGALEGSDLEVVTGSSDGDALRLRAVSDPMNVDSGDRVSLCFRETSTGNVVGDLSAIGRTCALACISASACVYRAL